jgi:hypothetical protein
LVAERLGKIQFSAEISRRFFGTAPDPLPLDTTLVDSLCHAKPDIWNHVVHYLQPMQLKTLKGFAAQPLLAVIYPKQAPTFVYIQLEDEASALALPAENNQRRISATLPTPPSASHREITRKRLNMSTHRPARTSTRKPKKPLPDFGPTATTPLWYDDRTKPGSLPLVATPEP